MQVPLLDLREQLKPLREEIVERVIEVIDSTGYILGEKVTLFENEVAGYCKSRHAIGVSSGTDALLACLMALDIVRGISSMIFSQAPALWVRSSQQEKISRFSQEAAAASLKSAIGRGLAPG